MAQSIEIKLIKLTSNFLFCILDLWAYDILTSNINVSSMINFSVLNLSTSELFCVTCLIDGLSTILKVK